jgi:hypothetical protein
VIEEIVPLCVLNSQRSKQESFGDSAHYFRHPFNSVCFNISQVEQVYPITSCASERFCTFFQTQKSFCSGTADTLVQNLYYWFFDKDVQLHRNIYIIWTRSLPHLLEYSKHPPSSRGEITTDGRNANGGKTARRQRWQKSGDFEKYI